MSTDAEKYDVLTQYCFGHRCDACPMNDPALFCSDETGDDYCVLSYAQEALSGELLKG